MSGLIDVYCDFDGTVTRGDTIDYLLEELATPDWKEVEARWERGEIGSRECMKQQVPLIQGGWDAVTKILDKVKIDPTFPKFAAWCRREGVSLKIVSDGIDRVIHYILKREKIHVDNVWANHLVDGPDGRLELTFPHAPQVQGCSSGLCKCKILGAGPVRPLKVVIGDGRSDFCWSAEADVVFAKTKLLTHCRNSGIACVAYEDFMSIKSNLKHRLDEMYTPEPALIPGLAKAQAS
ncbi:MAG TPA: MtnX-like HAD-IB family phosphatase [Oculatellaceae cyanobacterium]